MNKLVLLTVSYPYKGERFINYEIRALAEVFSEIEIVPTNISNDFLNEKNIEQTLPANVVIRKDLAVAISLKAKGPKILRRNMFKEIFKKPNPLSVSKTIYRFLKANSIFSIIKKEYCSDLNRTMFYSYWLNSAALAISLMSKYYDAKSFCRAHGTDIYNEKSLGSYNPFQGFIVKNINRIFIVSNNGKEYLSRLYPAFHSKMTVSRLGVPIPKTRNEKSDNGNLRVVSCSRIDKNKRVDLIVKTLSKIRSLSISWIHFGDGKQKSYVIKLCEKLLARSNISYEFKGNVPNKKIHEYYSKEPIDLFVLLSKSEGIPVSIMEAMSYGISVIATDVGGVSEIVDEENGLLIPKNIESNYIAEKIKGFLKNQKKLKRLSRNARNKIELEYSEKNYRAFSKKLKNLGNTN